MNVSTSRLALELAVQDAAGAAVARTAGADRVELCSALSATGGITPTLGLIEAVVGEGLPVQVLIRCRPGPFVYGAAEVAVMARDAALAIEAGAAGVVFGALTAGNLVDVEAMARVRDAARAANQAAQFTCHRAMDVVIGAGRAAAAIQTLRELGTTRVLTSGGAATSAAGVAVLRDLVAWAEGDLEVMAGGGVRPDDIAALAGCGVSAVHLSAKASTVVVGAAAGPGGGTDNTIDVTSPAIAQAAAAAVAAVNATR
ncbi:MAG: hypothetical protein LBI33_10875 [Propionibacteriaceae bacterium]|jgi:copper homeostasis protein|nr:hypothetical protein [Propionibacteriaceae bacterium]